MCSQPWKFDPSKRTLDLSSDGDAVWIGVHEDANLYAAYTFSGTGTITLYGFDEHLSHGTAVGSTATGTGAQTLDISQYAWVKVEVTTANTGSAAVGYSREALT